jgi:hypothetical protein
MNEVTGLKGTTLVISALTVLVLSGGSNPASAEPEPVRWGQFSIDTPEEFPPLRIETIVITHTWAEPPDVVWAMSKTTVLHGSSSPQAEIEADSRTCAALLPALAKLPTLEAVSIKAPDAPYRPRHSGYPRMGVIYDESTYSLDVPAHWAGGDMDGRITLTGGPMTPIAAWVRMTMSDMQTCWRAAPPKPAQPAP